jgi:hypothetical protein
VLRGVTETDSFPPSLPISTWCEFYPERLTLTDERLDPPFPSWFNRLRQVVNYLFWLTYGAIGLQILLELAGASNQSGFRKFWNVLMHPFLGPFEGLFPDLLLYGHFRVRISYLMALGVYALVQAAAYGLIHLLRPKALA